MTNKRLDKKFMSWVWGIVRLFPLILFFFACISVILQIQQQGIITNDMGYNINFNTILIDGSFDYYYDCVIRLMPDFMLDIYFNIIEYFYADSPYFVDMFLVTCIYQVWVTIIKLLVNVLMILPNITNYFIEKFNHLGNKGDY